MFYHILKPHYEPHFDNFGRRVLDEKKQAAFLVSWAIIGGVVAETPELAIEAAKRVTAAPVLEMVK